MNASWNGRHSGASMPSLRRRARLTARLATRKASSASGSSSKHGDPALDPVGGDPGEPQQLLGRLASASGDSAAVSLCASCDPVPVLR